MSMGQPVNYETSRDYELLVRHLIEQEISGLSGVDIVEISHDIKMKGLSGFEHQIDILYRFRIWKTEMLVIVECKQYRKNVGVDDLLEFRSRIEDLRAHKGIFVSSSGFQSGAIEFARANRIALMLARGTHIQNILYQERPVQPEDLVEELRAAYLDVGAKLDSRISIDPNHKVVVIQHKRAKLTLEPEELALNLLYRSVCRFEESTREVFFITNRLPNVRTDKVLKAIILDEILTSREDDSVARAIRLRMDVDSDTAVHLGPLNRAARDRFMELLLSPEGLVELREYQSEKNLTDQDLRRAFFRMGLGGWQTDRVMKALSKLPRRPYPE